MTTADLGRASRDARRLLLKTAYEAGLGHLGADLSVVDILCVLYFAVARTSKREDRDRIVLSKAHASAAAYSVLALCGVLDRKELGTYGGRNSRLSTVVSTRCPGIEFSCGSLGYGIGYGAGVALGLRIRSIPARVFVVCGDGELQEGSNWEAVMFAASAGLGALTVIVDRNRSQKSASTEQTNALEPLADKWRSFGWEVCEVDGHDHQELCDVLHESPDRGGPLCVIANTIKGKGVSFMESDLAWHSKRLDSVAYVLAQAELEE